MLPTRCCLWQKPNSRHPGRRPALVERRRLLTALRAGSGSALTLVAAPPGYGKTTAVQAWCASQASPVAWLTLDRADNDPVRLWTYMATAVDRVRQGLGRRALQQLRLSGGAIENPVDELMNRVAAFSKHLVLVLDDFQEVTSPDALHSVQYAVKHLPASASLIVVTRSDPDLGLGSGSIVRAACSGPRLHHRGSAGAHCRWPAPGPRR